MKNSQFQKFQQQYPENCILIELIKSVSNLYIVRASIMFNGLARMNAHASGETIETAEDKAIERALSRLGFEADSDNNFSNSQPSSTPSKINHEPMPQPPSIPQTHEQTTKPPNDLSGLVAETSVHLTRIGWSAAQGQNYLLETFNKRARALLSEEELIKFLEHLKTLPDILPQQKFS